MRHTFWLIVIAAAAFSCSGPAKFGDIDLERWRNDRGACQDFRKEEIHNIGKVKPELLGKSSNEIGKMFGAPDIQQLGTRNQKIYIYFVESGPQCQDKNRSAEANKLIFRFNAVSLLTEINFQREMPE